MSDLSTVLQNQWNSLLRTYNLLHSHIDIKVDRNEIKYVLGLYFLSAKNFVIFYKNINKKLVRKFSAKINLPEINLKKNLEIKKLWSLLQIAFRQKLIYK